MTTLIHRSSRSANAHDPNSRRRADRTPSRLICDPGSDHPAEAYTKRSPPVSVDGACARVRPAANRRSHVVADPWHQRGEALCRCQMLAEREGWGGFSSREERRSRASPAGTTPFLRWGASRSGRGLARRRANGSRQRDDLEHGARHGDAVVGRGSRRVIERDRLAR
jgi:hypothetical protein